ncbi:hypothetical protein BJV82DRAFT_487804, partial [Fennellomyces sp. T-0311]
SRERTRVLSADIQWCIDNKSNLALKSFAEEFKLSDKQYTISRYSNIIKKHHFSSERTQLE